MKLLVVSDTHGEEKNLIRAIKKEKPFDALLHLGDSETTRDHIQQLCGCPVYVVAGNCDYFSGLKPVQYVDLGGHRLMLAHGHRHSVRESEKYLADEARANGCDIALYGHLHIPSINCMPDGMWVLNPGSLSYPRQAGRQPSYMVVICLKMGAVGHG